MKNRDEKKNGKTKLNPQISDLTSQWLLNTHGLNISIKSEICGVDLKNYSPKTFNL